MNKQMKTLLILSFFLLSVTGNEAFAATSYCNPSTKTCLGKLCDPASIGTTIMDKDKKNIIACLYDDSTTSTQTHWRSISGGGINCGPTTLMGPGYHGQLYMVKGDSCTMTSSENGITPNPLYQCLNGSWVLVGALMGDGCHKTAGG